MSHFIIFETDELRAAIEMLYCPIFDAYVKAGDSKNAKKCLNKLLYLVLENEFLINGIAYRFKRGLDQTQRVFTFSQVLAEKHFIEIRRLFTEGDSEYVLCELKNLVSKHSSIEDFKEFFNIEEDVAPQDLRAESVEVDEGKVRDALTLFDLPSDTGLYEVQKKFKMLILISHPDKVYRMRTETPESHQQRVVDAIKRQYEVKAAYNVLLQWFLKHSKPRTTVD